MIDTKKERTYRDTAYNPLYVPLPQHNPRSGNEEEKRLSTSDSTGQGSATSKPPLGSRNIANYFTCIIGCLHADRRETLQPLPEPGFVCVRARKSEADRVPKAETRSAPVGSLNLAPTGHTIHHDCLRDVRRSAVMRTSTSDRLLSMTDDCSPAERQDTQGVDHGPMLPSCVTRSPASDYLLISSGDDRQRTR
jgi:hypothetical protein